jgi:mannose-1-phosphate guanylyltransferase
MAGDTEESTKDLVVVIMAGGAGTRFWPVSTRRRPKQFLRFLGERTLLQRSFDRVRALVPPHRLLVLTHAEFVALVREQLPEIPAENVIGEPLRRDTAAAVCLGALLCRRRFGNPVMAMLTADHVIEPEDAFHRVLLSAARHARASGALYTFGIPPTFPATGYGYLELGPKVQDDDGIEHFRLLRFKEKPDLETAREYVRSGRYQWNSGMFAWTTDAILEALLRDLPGHLDAMRPAVALEGASSWGEALERAFRSLSPISIDYAVMERAPDVRCVGCGFRWTDVGGWAALREFLPADGDGNAFRGRIVTSGAAGNLVFCEDPDEKVMLVGIQDVVVVRAGKRTLVVHRDRTEEIKGLVQGDPDEI